MLLGMLLGMVEIATEMLWIQRITKKKNKWKRKEENMLSQCPLQQESIVLWSLCILPHVIMRLEITSFFIHLPLHHAEHFFDTAFSCNETKWFLNFHFTFAKNLWKFQKKLRGSTRAIADKPYQWYFLLPSSLYSVISVLSSPTAACDKWPEQLIYNGWFYSVIPAKKIAAK